MQINLFGEEIDSAFSARLRRISKARNWTLAQKTLSVSLESADLNTFASNPGQIILVYIDSAEGLKAFSELYRNALSGTARLAEVYLFSKVFCHRQAAELAGLKTIHYFSAPDSDADLEHYLLNIGGGAERSVFSVASIFRGQLAEVIDHSAIISMTDLDGNIIFANDHFCKISGYNRDELIGQNHAILKSDRHSASKYEVMWKTIQSGSPWRGYFCNKKKSGAEYWVDSVIYPIRSESGDIVSYISVRYDVTKEKHLKDTLIERDKRFRMSHQFANIGSWDWDIESGDVLWSDEIHKLFGYPSPVLETNYQNFLQAIYPEDREQVESAINAALNEGKEYQAEFRVVYPDGTLRWLADRGQVVLDNDGKPRRMLGVISDIHKLKKAQEAAVRAERLTSTFVSTLSHEIRNPLNALSGYNRLIEDLSTSAELTDYTMKVGRIIEHISGIISDINLNSKLESGNIAQNLEPLSMSVLVDESLELLSHPEKAIHIEQGEVSGSVLADAQHLRQVIVNILSNACKYNKPGGKVFIRSQVKDGGTVRLEIEDTGVGIPEHKVGTIFQPFERLDWQKSEVEGLGLGLSICKLLVNSMKGTIGVSSVDGQGSTFWIELPQTSALPRSSEDAQGTTEPQRLPETILVLEDNEFNQEFMREQLEKLGINASFASNGVQGMRLVESQAFDLVITDLNMPEMGGLEFIKRVRGHEKESLRTLPIVIISADNSGGERYKDAYQTGFLVKPFALKDLINMLAKKYVPQGLATEKEALAIVSTSASPVVDMAIMRHFLGDEEQSRNRLLNLYLQSLKHARESMLASHANYASKPMASLAHKLYSSSQSIGATTLAAHFKELEQLAKINAPKDQIEQKVERVNALSSQVIDYLQSVADCEDKGDEDDRGSSKLEGINSLSEDDKRDGVSILVVDDDPFSISQISEKLSGTPSVSFKAERDSEAALALLKNEHFDIVILDIDMPNIDGIQFVRLFAPIYQNQAMVLFSGETTLIAPVAELIHNYGMHYLGVLNKPSSRLAIYRLLSQYKKNPNSVSGKALIIAANVNDDTIKDCIENDKITVLYQPQVEVNSRRVIYVEALSRLRDESGTLIPPAAYLHRLEPLGLERSFARKVACQAIRQISTWSAQGHDLKVAINFSMHALEDLDLPNRLKTCCEENAIAPSSVVIEVTETALCTHPKLALEAMVRLKLLGFTLSIDDFGTGYSSLDKLQKLPFSEMKLDRSYVSTAGKDDVSMALLTSSLGLAQQLKMRTIAEGIESLEDYQLVESAGAQSVQGFYFAKPLPPEQLIPWKEAFNHDSSHYF